MLVDVATADSLFMSLPPHLRLPSLSPRYAVADARRDGAIAPLFLAWSRDDRFLLHAIHEAGVPGEPLRDWQSPYGYGGPLASELSAREADEAWGALDEVARDRQVVAEFVRFHPLAENHRHYRGAVRDDRSVVTVPLQPTDLLASYSGRARTAIRKADKAGLRAVWEPGSRLLSAFPGFYRDGMRELGAAPFYLFGDAYFEGLLALPEARLATVSHEGTTVAMGVFLFGTAVAEYLLSATTQAGRSLGATNLLLHAAASRAQEEGLGQLYLGGGTDAHDSNPLLWFKASFAEPTLRFRTGHRIHDEAAYARLRDRFPEQAGASRRILFYRGH